MKAIKQLIKKNRISCLTHFTRLENLKSILTFGILPSKILQSNKTFSGISRNSITLPAEWDSVVSLNISFPDYKIFNLLQNHQPAEWAILLIDARILYEFPCYFFSGRAMDIIGSAPVPGRFLVDYQSPADLKKLFADTDSVKRKDLGIPSWYPTDPRAEVLCQFPIGPSYITQVFFASDYKFNMWVLSNTEFAVSRDRNLWATGLQYFSPRSDYTFWKTQRNFD